MRKNFTVKEATHTRLTEAAQSDGFRTGFGRGGQTDQYISRLLDLRELARQRDWRKLWALVDKKEKAS